MSYKQQLLKARTFLFVPGNRPDRFDKARESGADVVVLDLEDAVSATAKTAARKSVCEWLGEGHQAVVRINAAGTRWFDDDLLALAGLAPAVMLPKTETSSDILKLPKDLPVIPLVETAAGVLAALKICSTPGVVRPAFGSVDLALELGIDHSDRVALRHARSALVLASAAARLPGPIDGVSTELNDDSALLDDMDEALSLGFTAKLCIHPRQVPVVHQKLVPSEDAINWARAVVQAAGDGSATALEGQMIDLPVLLRAQALLGQTESTVTMK